MLQQKFPENGMSIKPERNSDVHNQTRRKYPLLDKSTSFEN